MFCIRIQEKLLKMLWGFKPVGFEDVERPRRIGEEFS
jgi:hypothetical protein